MIEVKNSEIRIQHNNPCVNYLEDYSPCHWNHPEETTEILPEEE